MLGVFIAAARYIPSEKSNCRAWWDARIRLGSNDISYLNSIGGMQNALLTTEVTLDLFTSSDMTFLPTSLVLRTMQERGLHRESVLLNMEKRDEEWLDIVRSIWWCALKKDLDSCTLFGSPPATLAFDVQPPKHGSELAHMPYFRAMCKGLQLKAQALGVTSLHDSLPLKELNKEITVWLSDLQFYFPFTPGEKDDTKFFTCAKAWLFAYDVVLTGHRYNTARILKGILDGKNEEEKERAAVQHSIEDKKDSFPIVKDSIKGLTRILQALQSRSNHGMFPNI